MPDMEQLLTMAMEHGQVRAIVGQRHDSSTRAWVVPHESPKSDISVFHAYGFGGSGLTLGTGRR